MADEVTPEEEAGFIIPWSDWICSQRDGALDTELTQGLRDLIEAVSVHGKSGTITLKLTVKPGAKGTAGSVLISDDVAVKPPKQLVESFFFVDDAGNPTRNNPRQFGFDGPVLEVPERSAAIDIKEPRS